MGNHSSHTHVVSADGGFVLGEEVKRALCLGAGSCLRLELLLHKLLELRVAAKGGGGGIERGTVAVGSKPS